MSGPQEKISKPFQVQVNKTSKRIAFLNATRKTRRSLPTKLPMSLSRYSRSPLRLPAQICSVSVSVAIFFRMNFRMSLDIMEKATAIEILSHFLSNRSPTRSAW